MFDVIAKIDNLISEMDNAAMNGNGMCHYAYRRLVEIREMLTVSAPKPEDVKTLLDIPKVIRVQIEAGAKINAIKEHRTFYNSTLMEAKDCVESWIQKFYPSWIPVSRNGYWASGVRVLSP